MINPISKQPGADGSFGSWQRWVIVAIGVSVVLALPLIVKNTYYVQVVTLGLLFAYLALAWNIVGGMAGQLSFGHAIFFGIGAYTSTILFRDLGLTPWVGMLVGGLLSGLIAMMLGYPTFRLRGAYFALATLAFGEIARAFVNNTNFLFGIEVRGSRGILVPLRGQAPLVYQFEDKRYFYYVILILLVILIYTVYRLKRSKLGLYLSAIGDNEEAAVSLGINASAAKLKAFLISASFTAVGGTFYAQLLHFVDAPSVFGGSISLMLVLFATTGGPAYLLGPVVGTLLLMPIAEITRISLAGRFTGVHMVIYGLILVLVMRFMPRGVMFEAERFIKWWKRRRSSQMSSMESHTVDSQGVKHGTS